MKNQLRNQTKNFSIIETNSIGNGNTFARQIDILSSQDKSEVVYFAEDDYLYVPGEFNKAVEFIKEESVDFISCYMPLDVFRHPIHNHGRHTKYSQDKLWMSASSTCLTILPRVRCTGGSGSTSRPRSDNTRAWHA